MSHNDDFSATEPLDDADDFGDLKDETQKPFWKRELLFGYSLPWVIAAGGLFLGAAWYLLAPSFSSHPSDAAFSEVENTMAGASPGASRPVQSHTPGSTSLQPPSSQALTKSDDTQSMMTDIRDELNDRDGKINGSINTLKDGVNKLSDAIKRDEAYGVESRNQLNALSQRIAALEAHQSTESYSDTPKRTAVKRHTASAVAGMKVVSMDSGMAWIKWEGSTWAVREGDTLGKVTIRQIDSATRTVMTTGGALR